MKRLVVAARKLLPSSSSFINYWLLSGVLIGMVALGLRKTDEQSGTLWGLTLSATDWDEPGSVIQQAYREMIYHVWTVIALPYVCFFGIQPLVKSFRRDFVQFLRYSHSSRQFVESARILAVVGLVFAVSLPFLAGAALGRLYPGLNWDEALYLIGSCGGTILFIVALIYMLAAVGIRAEIIVAVALVTPFFLTGFREYLRIQHNASPIWHWLPPGLPYTGITRPWLSSYLWNTNLLSGIGFAIGVLVLRLLAASHTRWLLADREHRSPSGGRV